MLIVRLLTFFGFAILARMAIRNRSPRQSQQRDDQHASPASNQSTHAGQKQPFRTLTPSSDGTSQAEEYEHRRAERWHWKWSIILTAASTAGALAAAWFASGALNASWDAVKAARDQTDIARTASLASTRAWINVSVDPTSVSLTWDKADQPTIKATLKGTNEGNAPATDVQVFPVLFFPQSGRATAIRSRIKTLCSGVAMLGNIVFVKDGLTQISSTSLQDDLLKDWIDQFRKEIAPDQRPPAPLSLALCATYKIIGDSDTHHTARIYTIGRAPPDAMVAPFVGEDLAPAQVVLWREYNGEYAD